MSHVFTKKAEGDGVGKAGKEIPAGSDLTYLLSHNYAKPIGAPDPREGGPIVHDATATR